MKHQPNQTEIATKMMYCFQDALSDEAFAKAFELGEFRMLVPADAIAGQTVQFRGHPAILATIDTDEVPEGFVAVDICPYF